MTENLLAPLYAFREHHPVQTMKINGVWWEYILTEEREHTLLFLHGMLGSCDIWWQQIEAFEADYRILSVTYPAIDTLEGLAEGIWRLMAYYGIHTAAVIGSSMGGYLAQYLLARYPERWTHAVLGNTFPPNEEIARSTRWLRRVLPLLPERLIKHRMQRHIETVIYPTSDRSDLVKAVLLEQLQRIRKADLLARYRCILEPFTPPDPDVLPAALLLVESDNDPMISPALRQRLKVTYPQARVYTFEGAGHFPYINRAEVYNRVLREFLAAD